MKSPERDLTTTLPSAENGSTGLHFSVSHYRRTSLKGPPTTFHTVSEDEFSELRLLSVLRSSHSPGPTPMCVAGRDRPEGQADTAWGHKALGGGEDELLALNAHEKLS